MDFCEIDTYDSIIRQNVYDSHPSYYTSPRRCSYFLVGYSDDYFDSLMDHLPSSKSTKRVSRPKRPRKHSRKLDLSYLPEELLKLANKKF
jgi:hypothetical protein